MSDLLHTFIAIVFMAGAYAWGYNRALRTQRIEHIRDTFNTLKEMGIIQDFAIGEKIEDDEDV